MKTWCVMSVLSSHHFDVLVCFMCFMCFMDIICKCLNLMKMMTFCLFGLTFGTFHVQNVCSNANWMFWWYGQLANWIVINSMVIIWLTSMQRKTYVQYNDMKMTIYWLFSFIHSLILFCSFCSLDYFLSCVKLLNPLTTQQFFHWFIHPIDSIEWFFTMELFTPWKLTLTWLT